MSEDSDYSQPQTFSDNRLLATMTIVAAIAVLASLRFADWRITGGIVLGCGLSFVNFWWARKSLGAMFAKSAAGTKTQFSIVRYFFRYIIFTIIVGAAHFFGLVSIAATLIGLLTFAAAIFISAFIELFNVLLKREDI